MHAPFWSKTKIHIITVYLRDVPPPPAENARKQKWEARASPQDRAISFFHFFLWEKNELLYAVSVNLSHSFGHKSNWQRRIMGLGKYRISRRGKTPFSWNLPIRAGFREPPLKKFRPIKWPVREASKHIHWHQMRYIYIYIYSAGCRRLCSFCFWRTAFEIAFFFASKHIHWHQVPCRRLCGFKKKWDPRRGRPREQTCLVEQERLPQDLNKKIVRTNNICE
jgi:hypothetical protein